MIIIEDVMARLAKRRPVFCSEADFQHELAYDIRISDPSLKVRLEWPVAIPSRGAIDIVIINDKSRFALELKYLCKGFVTAVGGEEITLKNQSAYDVRRYDVCKDVKRMEGYADRTGYGAAVLVLSNDPAYWQKRRNHDTADAKFNISHLGNLTGELSWGSRAAAGTTKGRESVLDIKGNYTLNWYDYSKNEGKNGEFRYLWIPVAPPMSA